MWSTSGVADTLNFGEQLRRFRVEAGLTQKELAERANISVRGLSDLERGVRRAPYRDTVRRLAEALRLVDADRVALLLTGNRSRSSGRTNQPTLKYAEVERSLPAALQTGLPLWLTSFIGRQRELAQVREQLKAVRLLTLTGPGGIGKTRLAVEAVQADITDHPYAVEFVDLAPLGEASFVPQVVAARLGVREQPDRPLVESLTAAIRGHRLLLVLDNCEHLLGACAGLAEALLRGCPQLSLLTTSREALRVPGEVVWPVPALSLPVPGLPIEPERLMQCEAVRVFMDRATAARAGFALAAHNAPAVARICLTLDGIPLAIELAAARARALSAEQIADHLTDRFALLTGGPRTVPARHQALSAAVDWSYDLLTPTERMLFDRLSVFAGGWTLEAAEAICGSTSLGSDREDVLDRLTRLIDSSLLIMQERDGAARYHQLETLRAYGYERLEASGATQAIRDRHAAYYLKLAEGVSPRAEGPAHSDWLRCLEADHDNLRSALAWLTARDARRGLRLAASMERYWYLRGLVAEGCRWLEELLARVPERTILWGRAALGLANLLDLRRDQVAARHEAELSLAILRAAGDFGGAAHAARFLGQRAAEEGDGEQARCHFEESLDLARQANDHQATARVLGNLGLMAIAEQDLPEARKRFEEQLTLSAAIAYRYGDVSGLARLGVVARLEGDYRSARALIEKGLALAQAFGHRPATCTYFTSLGNLARCEGNYAEARRLLAMALALGQRDVPLPLVLLNTVGSVGALAVAQSAYGPGVRLLAALSAGGAPRGTVQFPELRYDSEAALGAARTAVGESAYAAAWAEGHTWCLEEAIRQAVMVTEPSPAPTGRSDTGASGAPPHSLTSRQREVTTLVAQGLTNRQIGEALVITEGTARVHVEHILARLGFRSRAHLAGWAVARGILTPSA